MGNLFLSASEQRFIFKNPQALALLMIHHDTQQDQADNMGMDCQGNANRYEELKAHGRAIVLQDPDIWDDDTLRAFDVKRRVVHPTVPLRGGKEGDVADHWKCGDEFLPFHPQASHVNPDYRDGWNACYRASVKSALSKGYVPLSDDGRTVFIDGMGEVPLASAISPSDTRTKEPQGRGDDGGAACTGNKATCRNRMCDAQACTVPAGVPPCGHQVNPPQGRGGE